MIRALTVLLFLAACVEFPQVDAAARDQVQPRPAYLTPAELAAVNAALAKPNRANVDAQGDALRDSADELRAQ